MTRGFLNNLEKNFYELLVDYDKAVGLDVIRPPKEKNENIWLSRDKIEKFKLPVGEHFLLVSKLVSASDHIEDRYEFMVFKVEGNHKRIIQGQCTALSEDMGKKALSFSSSIHKSDIFSPSCSDDKGKLKQTGKDEFCLCELPAMVDLFKAQVLLDK